MYMPLSAIVRLLRITRKCGLTDSGKVGRKYQFLFITTRTDVELWNIKQVLYYLAIRR